MSENKQDSKQNYRQELDLQISDKLKMKPPHSQSRYTTNNNVVRSLPTSHSQNLNWGQNRENGATLGGIEPEEERAHK